MAINRDSLGYRTGRLIGRLVLLSVGYVLGKNWGRKPIRKSFPEKK